MGLLGYSLSGLLGTGGGSSVPDMPTLNNVSGHWISQASDLTAVSPPLDDGEAVNQWDDETASLAASQGTGSKQPTWDATGEYLDFDGSDVMSHASFAAQTKPFCCHFLIYPDSFSAIRGLIEMDERWAIWVGTNSRVRFTIVNSADYEFTGYTMATGSWLAMTVTLDASNNATLWVSGTEVETISAGAPGSGAVTLHLGSYDKFSLGWDGRIKRIIVQDEIPSDATIEQLHDHLEGNV
ncbi:MAG: hypothetical protein ACPHCN_08400 [Mycobacterium sp.]